MKMKVILTRTELLGILSSHFGQTVTDVEMESDSTMAELIRNTVTKFNYRGSEKIGAIRALRQLSVDNKWQPNVIGLADAKWAIENFAA